MIPVLYPSNETEFETNGLGSLTDVISCVVTEERNGAYELEMQYPINGIHYSEIQLDTIIFAKPSDGAYPQPFTIYKNSKPIKGIVTFYARHIGYRLGFIPVKPFTMENATPSDIMAGFVDNSVGDNPFKAESDIDNQRKKYKQELPLTFRECIGGVDGSLLDLFNGELEWDTFKVILRSARGNDNGVRIAYSKNLLDLKQDESNSDSASSILPYWSGKTSDTDSADQSTTVIYGDLVSPEKPINTYSYTRIALQDLTRFYDNNARPTEEELTELAKTLIGFFDTSSNTISIDVSFVALWETEEYKNISILEHVKLCDTVSVEFKELGVDTKLKVVTTVYDTLNERYTKIKLGEIRKSSTLAGTISSSIKSVATAKKSILSTIETALQEQTKKITGAFGGNVVIITDANGNPSEVVFGNTDNINTMTKCIRVNCEGIGFSDEGYNPTSFNSVMTIDGRINANYILAGEFDGGLIKAGTIKLEDVLKDTDIEDIAKYVHITGSGITLGSSDSPIKMVLVNDKLKFVNADEDDKELAYISNNRFYAPSVTVQHDLIIGGYSESSSETGAVSFSWVGISNKEV